MRFVSLGIAVLGFVIGLHQLHDDGGVEVRSVARQTIHFLSRSRAGGLEMAAHSTWLNSKLVGTWTGEELLKEETRWRTELDSSQQAELVTVAKELVALLSLKVKGKPKERDLSLLDLRGFVWPEWVVLSLIPKVEKALSGPRSGLGFHVIRGFPVNSLTDWESAVLFWSLGRLLGTPGAQDSDGKLLGEVRDIGGDPLVDRQYKTKARIRFHADGADIVALLCKKRAKSGGESKVASTLHVFNELLRRRSVQGTDDQKWRLRDDKKEDLARLFEPQLLDARGSGGIDTFSVPLLAADESGLLRTFYHAEYYKSAYRYNSSPPADPRLLTVLGEYEQIAEQSALSMDFLEGDVQLVNNNYIVHAWSAFQDQAPDHVRHLLRLWLSMPTVVKPGFKDFFSREKERARLIAQLAWKKLEMLY